MNRFATNGLACAHQMVDKPNLKKTFERQSHFMATLSTSLVFEGFAGIPSGITRIAAHQIY